MNADPLILLVPDIEVAAASQDVADFLQFCESTSSIWNLQTNVFSTHLCVMNVLLEECLHFIVVLGQFFGMHSDDVRVGISAIVTKVKRLAQGANVVRSLSSARLTGAGRVSDPLHQWDPRARRSPGIRTPLRQVSSSCRRNNKWLSLARKTKKIFWASCSAVEGSRPEK